jgi:hypothetical protein
MQKRSKRIKWSLVDLTRPASELAEELGVSLAAIYNARKRLGIEAPNLAGGKEGNKGGAPKGNQNALGNKGNSKPDEQKIKMTYVRMLPAEIEALHAHARRQKTTYSELVRLILQKYLREQDKTDGQETLN